MNSEWPDTTKKKSKREWYSVSLTSVGVVVVIGVLIVGFFLYKSLGLDSVQKRAERVIDVGSDRLVAVERDRDDIEQIKRDHGAAWELHAKAIEAFDAGDFEAALEDGERALVVLDKIESQGEGSIRVLAAHGSVEVRRGERGTWKRLRSYDTLTPGDWVKTSVDGTAELLFPDRSVFTLRQSTMVHLGGELGVGDETTDVKFGRLELSTTDNDRTVTTPRAQARVRRATAAYVSFDREREAGRFAAFTGGLEVTSIETGEKREVRALELVDQYNDRLEQIRSLPDQPMLTGPAEDHTIDLGTQSELTLAWKPAKKARRYVLAISNNRLFATHLVENRRLKSSARIGVRREGEFFWRVAALDAQDHRGPWSDTRSFRAVSESRIEDFGDKEPPELKILNVDTYGTVVIVNGQTEVGATVTINNESVAIKSDGSFQKTLQMTKAGRNVLQIVSTDAWNNVSTQKKTVFIDAI